MSAYAASLASEPPYPASGPEGSRELDRPRKVIHIDMDAFFASVEQRDQRQLRGRPVIVGAGVVLAASYEAKAYGVRTAMGVRPALRLCPHAAVVSPRFTAYSEASKAVFRVFDDMSPSVEGLSIDEAFLDVRGMERSIGSPLEIATRLRRRVRAEVGLPITVGIARTKFLAKVASAVAKPDGLLLVPADGELDFLHPLPVEALWGVGPVTSRKLRERGLGTVGQVARLPEELLVSMLGRASGRHLHALAHNLDPRPVQPRRRRGSIGSQHARGRRPWTVDDVDADLVALVDRVTRRMRVARRVGRTVVLRLRFDDFKRATRSHTLPFPTASTELVLAAARGLFATSLALLEERGLTLVGVAVTNLENADAVQLVLPFDRRWSDALDAALDEVRERFGSSAVTRGVLVGRTGHLSMPVLPD
jgi:DNA polymerase IV